VFAAADRVALDMLIKTRMHATFLQKVILCMIAGFLAASLVQWGKVFVTGADDALNAGYNHRTDAKLPNRR
jgi:hypothetical protein